MSKIKVSVVQHACSGQYEKNLQIGLNGIKQAAAKGADLVLLPELNTHFYFCIKENLDYFDFAEPIPGPSTEALQAAAKENNIIIVATIFEKRAKGLYHNTAIVLDKDGSLAGTYQKMHIPDDPGFYEKYYFTPGDKGFVPIDTSIGKLGGLICWENRMPQARLALYKAGVQIYMAPTADARSSWIASMRHIAVEGRCYVISCNQYFEASDYPKKFYLLFLVRFMPRLSHCLKIFFSADFD